ncbi:MAG: cupredoxin family copper-binding protein [Methanomicrobiales archaeon]
MRCTPKPVHWAILIIILATFIAISGCASYGPSSTTIPTTTPIVIPGAPTITIQNFAFTPASITAPKGTTVTWVNEDSANHQIVSDTQGTFTSSSLPKGASYSFKFDTPGTYPYHCSLHPSMKGTVIVT